MEYPIFIHKDPKSDYEVIVPDLPGCFSAGSNVEEAIKNTKEAIECHLEGLLLDGDPIPIKKPLEQHLDNPDLKDAILAIVHIDLAKIPKNKTKRIDITLPELFLKQIDKYIKHSGNNRSAFLAEAAMNFMAEHKLEKKHSHKEAHC